MPRVRGYLRRGRRRRHGDDRTGSIRGSAYAALDLGTNNCRLLIAHPARRGLRVVDSFSRIVRLGEGVSTTGMLSDAAMGRTIEALKICAEKMSDISVSQSRSVVTAAGRQARNRTQFVHRVRQETGIDLEVISSREEATLTMKGCLPLVESSCNGALLFDVGGGSAEFVLANIDDRGEATIEGCVSLPCGVVTVAERYGGCELAPDAYQRVIADVMDLLAPFDRRFGVSGRVSEGRLQIIGTAGTITTIAGVNMRLTRYNRSRIDGSWLEVEAIRRISREILKMSVEERAAHPCIGWDRADYILVGCAVLEAVCAMWPTDRMRVADRGVREGILTTMMQDPDLSMPRASS